MSSAAHESDAPSPAARRSDDPRPSRSARLWDLFAIDHRSLAFFRVFLGGLMVADVIKRSLGLVAHYTDQGVMPRQALFQFLPDPLVFQAFLVSGSTAWVAFLFAVAALMGVLVAIGWHAQLATWIYLFLQISARLRNPFANHTGDDYFTCILFFTGFLPLSHTYSLTRFLKPTLSHVRPKALSLGTAAILLQIAAFYVVAGIDKHGFEVWTSGSAVSHFADIDQYTRPLGEALRDWPRLCRFGTYFTLALEIGGPVVMFLPWFTPWIRIVVVLLFAGFHLGIQSVVYIGIFEMVSVAAVFLYMPAKFWDLLARIRPLQRVGSWLQPFERVARGASAWRAGLESDAVVGVAMAIMLYSNAYSARYRESAPLPIGPLNKVVKLLYLKQRWTIFSELDKPKTGWFLALGRLPGGSILDPQRDGTVVNLWNGRPFDGYQKPVDFASDFPNHNWRRYWNNIRFPDRGFLRPYLARYLVERYNREHPARTVDAMVLLWISPDGGVDDRSKREPLILYEAPQDLLTASWWLPATPVGVMPR